MLFLRHRSRKRASPSNASLIRASNVRSSGYFTLQHQSTRIDKVWYARFWIMSHRWGNRRFSTLSCTKIGGAQPKLRPACFVVQSCLADADFVVFSDYCLIGTRLKQNIFLSLAILHHVSPEQYCGIIIPWSEAKWYINRTPFVRQVW